MAEPFVYKRRVHFAETDLAGVLHFANYYRLMEECEHAWWRSIGMSVVIDGPDSRVSWPRVATACEYFQPARFDDELSLSMIIEHVGTRSMSYEVVFRRGEERLAVGRSTIVCCAMVDGRFGSVDIPDDIRSKLPVTDASAG